MARIEPTLLPVVADLERGLRELGVPFGIIGALVPGLLLEARPDRMTNDADVMVVVETLSEFDALKGRLATYGFERTRLAHRLRHTSGGHSASTQLSLDPVQRNPSPPSGQLVGHILGQRARLRGAPVNLQPAIRAHSTGFKSTVPKTVPTRSAKTASFSSGFLRTRIFRNRRLRFGQGVFAEVPRFRILAACGEVAERLKAAVC